MEQIIELIREIWPYIFIGYIIHVIADILKTQMTSNAIKKE